MWRLAYGLLHEAQDDDHENERVVKKKLKEVKKEYQIKGEEGKSMENAEEREDGRLK
jgi:hypothetical protein